MCIKNLVMEESFGVLKSATKNLYFCKTACIKGTVHPPRGISADRASKFRCGIFRESSKKAGSN